MKVQELMELIGAKNLNPQADLNTEISCGYACDLLSWVLAHPALTRLVLTHLVRKTAAN